MKEFFKTNQIWAITIGGVLASVIAAWVLNSMPGFDGVWKSLSGGTRTGILVTSTSAVFVIIGLGVALYAGRLARIAAARDRLSAEYQRRPNCCSRPNEQN